MGEYAAVCCCGEDPPICECEINEDWLKLSVWYQGRRNEQYYSEACAGPGTCVISDMPKIDATGELRTNYIEATFWLKCEYQSSQNRFRFHHNNNTADAEHPTVLSVSEIWRLTDHSLRKFRTGCDGGVCYTYEFAHFLGGTQTTIDTNSPNPNSPNERPGIRASTYIVAPSGGFHPDFDDRVLEAIRVTQPDFTPDPAKHYRMLDVQIAPVTQFPINIVAQSYIGCDLFSTQNDIVGAGPGDTATLFGAVGCPNTNAVSNIFEVYELDECDIYEQGTRIWKGVGNLVGFPPDCFNPDSPIYVQLPFEFEQNDPPDFPSYCGDLPSCCGFTGPGATITGSSSSEVHEINAAVTAWEIQT